MTLADVFDGWEGYNESLKSAIAPLTQDQLCFRAHPEMRSVEEVAFHLSHGRMDWFRRLRAPGAAPLFDALCRRLEDKTSYSAAELVAWLDESWKVIDGALKSWTIEDLGVTFEQPYAGKLYAVTHQWVIWRIITHDTHHGGQLSELLGMQGIFPTELTWLGGHLAEPTVIRDL